VVERMLVGVRPGQARLARGVGAEHVIVDEEIVVAESLRSLGVVLDGLRVVAEFRLGENNSVLHDGPPRGALMGRRDGVYRTTCRAPPADRARRAASRR